jgi:hypothetical protein
MDFHLTFHYGLVGEMIGEGVCRSVYLSTGTRVNTRVRRSAIKTSDVYNDEDGANTRYMKREVKIYKRLQALQGTSIPRFWFYDEAW